MKNAMNMMKRSGEQPFRPAYVGGCETDAPTRTRVLVGSNHLALLGLWIGLATLLTCNKTPSARTSFKTLEAVETKQLNNLKVLPTAGSGKAAADDRAALAVTFTASRCVMLGVVAANSNLYRDQGFADDVAFRKAFSRAAAADPLWARKVVDAAQSTPCGSTGEQP